MRTFAQKQNQSQRQVSSSLARSNIETHAEEAEARLTGVASPRFAFDFSRIAIHPPHARVIQTKLAINQLGDEYEQEADHVSEQVMRMPELKLQHVNGNSAEQERDHEPLQLKRFSGNDLGKTAAPPVVDDVLQSPGQPLDAETCAFMEPHFDYEFSRVRVHTGTTAEQSARALNANAYTVGHHIVFGADRFAPNTPSGRHLLAHELTHVVQQSGVDVASSSQQLSPMGISRGSIAIQRDSPKTAEVQPAPKFAGTGSKHLAKGVMHWIMYYGSLDEASVAQVNINFVPAKPYQGKVVTFLQTVLRTKSKDPGPRKRPAIDLLTRGKEGARQDDTDPFYGADWENKNRSWIPESTAQGKASQPAGPASQLAYFYDEPVVFPGQVKLFETVAVVPETGETLGAIRWGLDGGEGKVIVPDEGKDVTDAPSSQFSAALEKFYAQPATVGPDPDREERYDAILDGFAANDGSSAQKPVTLSATQQKQLDPIVTKVKTNSTMQVEVAGFADATEKDPDGTSEARARAVEDYLVSQGIAKSSIVMAGFFGGAWARYPPSLSEGRNRRVQVRVRMRD